MHTKLRAFLVLIFFLVMFPFVSYLVETGGITCADITTTQNRIGTVHRTSGDIPHATIDIISDDDFVTQAWPGSGTELDPYRIENLNITGGSNDPCIDIRDTRAYFAIKNCTLNGPSNDRAILLVNATNGLIRDNEIFDSLSAINALSSGNLTITDNWCNNTNSGIGLYGPGMTVTNNTITWGPNYGIRIADGDDSIAFNNTIMNSNNIGVEVIDSSNTIVTNNTCQNIWWGYWIHGASDYCTFANNSAYNGDYGVNIGSNWVTVVHNNITVFGKRTLYLAGERCTVASNSLSDGGVGMWLWGGSYNTIENNTCYQNDQGIVVNGTSHDNSFIGNIVDSNTENVIDNGTANFLGTNYWSDYVGTDGNGDGIGDTPYPIAGSAGNEDPHPLMTPSTPRIGTSWVNVPTNQHVEFGDGFRYTMNCTAPAPLYWWLTGQSWAFAVDSSGVITNSTAMDSPRTWDLTIWGRNIYSYTISASFLVNLSDTLAPTWDETPTDQFHEYVRSAQAFRYDLNASDIAGIDHYWVNDTVGFSVDSNGRLRSELILEIGEVYWLEVRAYDEYDHYCTATFKISVDDTIVPEIDSPEDEEFVEGVQGHTTISWEVTDQSLKSYTVLLNGSELESGTFVYAYETVSHQVQLTGLSVGVYNYTVVVEDEVGHVVSDTVLITVNPHTLPTDTTTDTEIPPPIPFEIVVVIGIIVAVVVIALVCRMRR
ncbi:MAG: right-handed parallel beta-helix repeat-containing protein [Candidatus Thorarchaeota archaeon]|nr:MAG: right-handed parallel beta-helix repeat-containing protein [Candidatus Thorarchaeota archaeon]